MKVGDYVRYKTLSKQIKIGKIINIFDENIPTYDLDNQDVTGEGYIIKSSPNIIDLIEVGDILTIKDLFGNLSKVEVDKEFELFTGTIVSIVTKEQFERCEYKI